jgi:hypothetical protein
MNATKTQLIVISRRDMTAMDDPLMLETDTVPFSDSVRNLGLFEVEL